MLTMCCTGAHLLPKMGKLNTLPTTARAQSIPARASFFVESAFMRIPPIAKRSRLSGLLSRRNTASHRVDSRPRALPLGPEPPTRRLRQKTKTGAPSAEAPVKTHRDDFLRRHYPHQVKGSKFEHFLSARMTSSPVFCCREYSTPIVPKLQEAVSFCSASVLY